MNTLTIEGWCKPSSDQKSIPIGEFHFHVSDSDHLRMEEAEERLQKTHEKDFRFDADMSTMELITPAEVGALSDCQWRVYLTGDGEHRGQFLFIGDRESDGCLVYTNAVMIDQLG